MIDVRDLTKEFHNANQDVLQVLKGVTFHVDQGDIYGVIGMSGAGKSTMLRLLGLLDTPTSGEILVEGKNIHKLKGKEKIAYYRSIGTVFQGYNLLMQKTVYDNVAFPLKLSKCDKQTIKERVDRLLELVGLTEKAKVYPSTLSGGQKQRVAIARALANQPKLLLCDEPTSALDNLTTQSILQLLQDINRQLGVTIVLITHEIQVVRSICNKVAVLDEGILVDNGPVLEVLKQQNHQVTQALFGKEMLA